MPNNPCFFLRILEFYFVMHWSVLLMMGSLVPFKFFHKGTQTFVVVSRWTLKLTYLLGFRLVLFNDSFFYTPFLGSLAPYSRHFFILIVGALAPNRRPQPSFIFFFFLRESFNLWRPLLMIALYYQTKTPISF